MGNNSPKKNENQIEWNRPGIGTEVPHLGRFPEKTTQKLHELGDFDMV